MIAESAFNDPTGTVLTLTAGLRRHGGVGRRSAGRPATSPRASRLGVVIGIGGGVLPRRAALRHAFGLWRESPAAAILAVVAAEYFASEEIGGSGYLAAFVMGLVVGNMELLGLRRHQDHFARARGRSPRRPRRSPILGVFVTLGLNLPLDALWDDLWGGPRWSWPCSSSWRAR